MSQILRRYLTKEGRVRNFFFYLIWIKEPCVRKFEGLASSKIDNYAKDGGPGEADFYVVFTMSLCALELNQTLISLLFQIIRL